MTTTSHFTNFPMLYLLQESTILLPKNSRLQNESRFFRFYQHSQKLYRLIFELSPILIAHCFLIYFESPMFSLHYFSDKISTNQVKNKTNKFISISKLQPNCAVLSKSKIFFNSNQLLFKELL